MSEIQWEIRLKLGAFTVAVMLGLAACGAEAEAGDDSSAVAETNAEQTVESDEGDVELAENPVETELVEEEFTVTAEQITILTDLQSVSHQQIPREEIFALAMSFNWDYITDEDKETIMNTYGVSLEDLDNYFRAYLERDKEMVTNNRRYYRGDVDTIETAYDYQYWIKYADFAFKPEDAEFASSVDYSFVPGGTELNPYDMEDNSSKYENSFNYTLFYTLYPSTALNEMENSVFMQSANTIVK